MTTPRRKSNDLTAIFSKPATAATQTASAPATTPEPQPRRREASREGKRGKLVYLTAAAEKQLTFIGAEHDKTQQALMVEAVNLLFERYGRDQIA
jgi:antitoxin-like ribbon-helix-helix protein